MACWRHTTYSIYIFRLMRIRRSSVLSVNAICFRNIRYGGASVVKSGFFFGINQIIRQEEGGRQILLNCVFYGLLINHGKVIEWIAILSPSPNLFRAFSTTLEDSQEIYIACKFKIDYFPSRLCFMHGWARTRVSRAFTSIGLKFHKSFCCFILLNADWRKDERKSQKHFLHCIIFSISSDGYASAFIFHIFIVPSDKIETRRI